MLQQLTINNYVIVNQLDLEFDKGFIALTGETGAGKSILIDALSLALGQRSESNLVRKGFDKADIVAVFDIKNNFTLQTWLQDHDFTSDDEVILRRVISPDGKSKAYINSTPCPIGSLQDIADKLIDIYSQNSHHSLTKNNVQREIVDSYGNLANSVNDIKIAHAEWQKILKLKTDFEKNAEKMQQEFTDLDSKLKELAALNFSFAEWEEIQNEFKMLSRGDELIGILQQCNELMDADDYSINKQIRNLSKLFSEAMQINTQLEKESEIISSVEVSLSELSRTINNLLSKLDSNESRKSELESFIQRVYDFSRKYRIDFKNIEQDQLEAKKRYEELALAFSENNFIQQEKEKKEFFMQLSAKVSIQRQEAASELSKLITKYLNQLSFQDALFNIRVTEGQPSQFGIDDITFDIAPFKGADLLPMTKVASGGELSRISLAIRVASAKNTNTPVMIFDEVDVGIGGGVAEVVGGLLKDLGREQQVFSITHLAQVAAKADHHFQVKKRSDQDEIISEIKKLDANERVTEIARMLGGIDITENTLEVAKEMLA
ncbi:MAG: DNA repair protein RecN [Nitrosomonadales bacterium]